MNDKMTKEIKKCPRCKKDYQYFPYWSGKQSICQKCYRNPGIIYKSIILLSMRWTMLSCMIHYELFVLLGVI